MALPLIEVQDLTKTFRDLRRGNVVAVDHISFEARAGEVFALLGANGAGKTTAMRMLCTVLRPTSGYARLAGFDVVAEPRMVRRNIGFMSASTAIYDRMSAWEMVEYFARLYGLEGERLNTRMEEVFTKLRMSDFRDVLGAKMSTGMRQKVSIARAIVHDPPVLIFDEPTLGLDVLAARAVLEAVEVFRASEKCVLYSTHIMREVERLCDRVAIINRGRILTMGSLTELREQYRQPDLEELFFRLVSEENGFEEEE